MRLAIFFVYLCFFLLKGGDHVHAVVSSYTDGYAHAQYIQISQPVAAAISCDAGTVINNTGTDNQNQFLIIDDVEDEDTNNFFARKFKTLARYYTALSCQSTLGYPINRSKVAPSFCGRISYKYILQRVLRV